MHEYNIAVSNAEEAISKLNEMKDDIVNAFKNAGESETIAFVLTMSDKTIKIISKRDADRKTDKGIPAYWVYGEIDGDYIVPEFYSDFYEGARTHKTDPSDEYWYGNLMDRANGDSAIYVSDIISKICKSLEQ